MNRNAKYDTPIAGVATIPAATLITGQITSDGLFVTGDANALFDVVDPTTGTKTARREFGIGDWIYDPGQGEVRRIKNADDRTKVIELEEAFTADIAIAINFQVIRDSIIKELSIVNTGIAAGVLDGQPFARGEEFTAVIRDKNKRGVDPIVVDGTGTTLKVQRIRY